MMNSGAESSSENPADKAKQDALYEDREPKKIIRIITVTAYMVSVSFVGIVLSAYYIFLWHPPNPRLMHAQAISSHSEPRVDFHMAQELDTPTGGPPAMIMTRMAPAEIDVFAAADTEARLHPEQERLKTRREIVKNVNPVLKANFEKGKSSGEATLGLQDVAMLVPVIAESLPSNVVSPNSSGDQTDRTRNSRTSSSLKNDASSEEASSASSTTATKKAGSVKKQHQMPFALKHLEVPIKSEGSRKRPMKVSTTPTTRGTSPDGTTPLGPPTTESSQSTYDSSPQQLVKSSLYRTLTTPASQRDVDYSTDLPLMPSISSDQFQAVPHITNDEEYHDSTIEPGADDLMDD